VYRGGDNPVNTLQKIGGDFPRKAASQIIGKIPQSMIFYLVDELSASVVIIEYRMNPTEWLIEREIACALSPHSVLCAEGACVTVSRAGPKDSFTRGTQKTGAPRHRFVAEHAEWREDELLQSTEEESTGACE